MHNQYISEPVDIYQLPSLNEIHEAQQGSEITIGDLHSNAIKLMFMLIKHGVAKHVSEKQYSFLIGVYLQALIKADKRLIEGFNRLISKIEFSSLATIRLIGDELADRGVNDYFILKILERLHLSGVRVEILVSNHGAEFIESYETRGDFWPHRLGCMDHAVSMTRLHNLINEGVVPYAEVMDLIHRAYKPSLRVLSYSLSHDNQHITMYSHAAMDISIIEKLAQKLDILFNGETTLGLAASIEAINTKFQSYVQNNRVHQLLDAELMMSGYKGRALSPEHPFEFILWNRQYEHLKRPSHQGNYQVSYVHGHDSYDAKEAHIINLDNKLGKCERYNKGMYTVLVTNTQMPEPKMQSIQEPTIIDAPKSMTSLLDICEDTSSAKSKPELEQPLDDEKSEVFKPVQMVAAVSSADIKRPQPIRLNIQKPATLLSSMSLMNSMLSPKERESLSSSMLDRLQVEPKKTELKKHALGDMKSIRYFTDKLVEIELKNRESNALPLPSLHV